MRKIVLLTLALRNFKGIREFTLEARGENVNVYGDNAVGKTTLFDAFTWVLFDKDSNNKKDFEIKTLRPDGKPIHNLEHEVEIDLSFDGRRTTLRKVYFEKWTQKRGSAKVDFTGHTTEYFIDGVPVKKGEYEDYVSSIVAEDIFKLLTNPTFFNEQLKWQDRRKTLLEVCGDITDDDVIASNPELENLPSILKGRTIENHKKVVAARRKDINDELDKIPVRISEVERSIPELPAKDESFYADEIATLREKVSQKQEEIIRIQSGGEVTEKKNRIREIEGELIELKNQLQGDSLDRIASAQRSVRRLEMETDNIFEEISRTKRRISQNEELISQKEKDRERLRQEWHRVNDRKFEGHQHDETCAACGQALPAERIAEAHRKAEEAFNLSKSRELEDISRRGKALAAEIESMKGENDKLKQNIEQLRDEHKAKQAEISSAREVLEALEASKVDVTSDSTYESKKAEIERLNAEIEELQQSTTNAIVEVRKEIAVYQAEIEALEREKAKFELAESARRRISELEQKEKELAEEFERLEHELFLLDEFTRSKVNLLETRINSKFRLVRFKLFRDQINGGLEECCEAMIEGVPYGSLNNAGRHNGGLDIIATLSEHYGIAAPIFLDNAESVTRPLDTPGQQIRLIVSAEDKHLRVETADRCEVGMV